MLRRVSDSDLIVRLRRRAYDPAIRLDEAYVPRDWLRRKYGDEAVRKITAWAIRRNGPEEAVLEAGSPEAVEFFKGAPREPPYPPVTASELLTAEQLMGCRLPELLRRLYTEVANGGFGPMPGILGITRSGQHDKRDVTAVEEYLKNSERDEPLGFPLIDVGCNGWWYVSLTKPGNPVYLFDWDCWDERDSPVVAIPHTARTLAEWLGRWADGHDGWRHGS
jgi:hypothetical protein